MFIDRMQHYHLPYVSVLNENKIIFGLSNLHFRFGHTSVIQYISTAFNNYLIPIESLSIPSALIFPYSYFFLFSFLKFIKKKEFNNSLIFLLTIITIYSYNNSVNMVMTHQLIFFLYCFLFI